MTEKGDSWLQYEDLVPIAGGSPEGDPPATSAPDPNQGRKMVPESDLIAVKKSLEDKVGKLETTVAEAQRIASEHYQNLVSERASGEAARTQLQTLQESVQVLEDLKTQLAASRQAGEDAVKRLLDLRKDTIMTSYNVPKTVLDGKNQHELDVLEEALKLSGAKKGSGIDTGGGVGASSTKTSRDKILSGLGSMRK